MSGQTYISFDDLIPPQEQPRQVSTESTSGISFDDLIPKQAPSLKQEYPKKTFFSGIDDPREYLRQLGLTARAGVEGTTKAIAFPINAVGSAVAGATNVLGAPEAAKYIEGNLGLTGGAKAAHALANALGLPKPQGKTEEIVQAGAQGLAGGVVGNPASGSPVLSSLLPSANTSKALLLNGGVAAGLEASPETTLGVGGALAATAAARGTGRATGQIVDGVLQKRAYDRLFKDNPRAAMDAEILANLAKIKRENGGTLRYEQVSAVADNYARNLSALLKQAGLSTEDTALAISGRKALSTIDPAVIKRLEGTPEGQAVLSNLEKSSRVRQLIPSTRSAGSATVGNIVNSSIDTAISATTGLPVTPVTLASAAARSVFRKPSADKVLTPRAEKAASDYLVTNGPSEATKGMEYLSMQAGAKAAQAEQSALAEATAKANLDALTLKGRKISGTPGGGAYQTLLEHTGLSSDDLNQALRVVEKIPEAREAVRAIRVGGGNTADGAIYPITDIIRKVASDMGLQSASKGVLSQQSKPGALSSVTPAYEMATKVRQGIIDEAIGDAGALKVPEAAKAARSVGLALKTTSDKGAREKLIQELYSKYPEAQGLFDGVLSFK